jgi:hypothetical protein
MDLVCNVTLEQRRELERVMVGHVGYDAFSYYPPFPRVCARESDGLYTGDRGVTRHIRHGHERAAGARRIFAPK